MRTIKALPRSAPSTLQSAIAVVTSPFFWKLETTSAEAVELCNIIESPIPARKAEIRLLKFFASHRRN